MTKLIRLSLITVLFFSLSSSSAFSQNLSWATQFKGINVKEISDGAVDNEGNIYTVGSFEGVVDFDPSPNVLNLNGGTMWADDIFITKQSPDGALIWVKQIGSTGEDRARSITITNTGDVVITGVFTGVVDFDPNAGVFTISGGESDIFILKLSGGGDFIWAKHIRKTTPSVYASGSFTYITCDNAGNLILAISFQDPFDFDPGPGVAVLTPVPPTPPLVVPSLDIAICKLSATGDFLWVKQIGNPDIDLAASVKVDNNGNIFFAGYIYATTDFDPGPGTFNIGNGAFGFSVYVSKFNSSGDLVWANNIDNTEWSRNMDIDFDTNNNLYVIGDDNLSKYSQNGNLQWSRTFPPGPNNSYNGLEGKSVAIDGQGNIFIVSKLIIRADFDPGPGEYFLSSSGVNDVAIAKYNVNGELIWANRIGGTAKDEPAFMVLDRTDKMIIGGLFSRTMDFDPGPDSSNLTSVGTERDIFVAKYFKSNTISGKVFKDNNGDGLQQANEPPLQNAMVKSTNGSQNFYGISDSTGKYKIATDPGTYDITPILPLYYNSWLPATHNAVFGSTTGVFDTANHFGLRALSTTKDLRVTITNLAPARPGFATSCRITYTNLGTDTVSGDIVMTYDNRLEFTSATPTPNNNGSPILRFDYLNLPPSMSRDIDVRFLVSTTVSNGTILKTYVTGNPIAGDFNAANNIDSLSHLVTGSYDPNDKTVTPAGDLTPDFINSGKYLDYTIRFQNTGTDTAFTVVIRDSLNSNLDFSTLETIAASHHYSIAVTQNNIVEWRFNNILLPDSNINEPRSHGFVRYRIKPKNALGGGSQIRNKAGIYFDYNLPVVTNETVNTVTVVTSVNPGAIEIGSKIFPNPTHSTLHLQAKGYFYYTVYDASGKIIVASTKEYNETDLDVSMLAKDIYFIEIKNSKGRAVHKIIVN
jgi:uncharacterized repeat protein (TIGR01451 family)